MRSDQEIGERLRKLRGDIPQKQVLRRLRALGIKLPALAISRIESGERALKFSEALGLAVVYNVSIDRIAVDTYVDADSFALTQEDRRAIAELHTVSNQIAARIEDLEQRLTARIDEQRSA